MVKSEVQAGLEIIQANCSRGKVVVDANLGGYGVYVTLFAPKDEQLGLLDKARNVEPFKGKEQFITLGVADLPFWECRLHNYRSQQILF